MKLPNLPPHVRECLERLRQFKREKDTRRYVVLAMQKVYGGVDSEHTNTLQTDLETVAYWLADQYANAPCEEKQDG